jgi:hypothetical protein
VACIEAKRVNDWVESNESMLRSCASALSQNRLVLASTPNTKSGLLSFYRRRASSIDSSPLGRLLVAVAIHCPSRLLSAVTSAR